MLFSIALVGGTSVSSVAVADDAARIDQRFSVESVEETPDFRQHVVPLMGKMGCNGRACHGSFQGRGGFRLSLFGYDFKADHEALTQGDTPRVNTANVAESLMLQKPLQVIPHEGGTRLKAGTWQERVLTRWIAAGAKPIDGKTPEFVRLEVTPDEIVAKQRGETFVLKAVAVWSNGAREDVTPLCRFQTNNDQIASVDDTGLVTSAGPGDSHVVVYYDNGVVPVPVLQPVSDKFGPNYPKVPTPTKIDELVVQKLSKLGMLQSDLCTDADFLRRVSLDMTGTLPPAAEVEAFLADTTVDKRARKIDELLERPAYAAWWATKFADWTGNNAGKLNNNRAGVAANTLSSDWYEWLQTRVEKNVPYDQIAEGIILAVSRQDDETYAQYCERMSGYYQKEAKGRFADQPSLTHYWIRREFTKPEERALGFAYTFLGVRIQCAQCHKHPFDQWTKDDFDRFKEFFARAQYGNSPGTKDEEKAMFEKAGIDTKNLKGNDLGKAIREHLNKGETMPFAELFVPQPQRVNPKRPVDPNKKRPQVVSGRTAKVLGGEEVKIGEMSDPREALMDWLRDDSNPYFARSIVNRIWAGYFNVGIVEPVDDLSLANPPSNEALLDYLTTEFRNQKFDMKWLHRTIANSRTYQLSWHPNSTNEFDDRNFARAVPHRLPAEVAYDALQLATMSDADAAKWQVSMDGRSIGNTIVDSRANGRGRSNYALTVFGRSIRDSNCECDRSSESSLLQTVYLQNDAEVLSMINGKGRWVDQILKKDVPDRSAKPGNVEMKERQARRVAELDLARLKQRLAAAEKKGRTDVVAALQKELAERTETPVDAAAVVAPKVAPEEPGADLPTIIRQAYLRTLSRLPTEAESVRAARYYAETGDVTRGTRDLLWALVNTKEFVVNH
ncbi:MAG: DUF1549 domain-containing protein [Planctomycetes bacterium]|nr:DUF1549 domain-containing protein [Planctomycetota bacterium]